MKTDPDIDMGEGFAARKSRAAEKLLICSDLLALSTLEFNTSGTGKTLRQTVSAMEREQRLRAVRDNGPPLHL